MKKTLAGRLLMFVLSAVCLILISADNAYATAGNPYSQTYTDDNGVYHPGNCTWQVWEDTYSTYGIMLPGWGNAGTWCSSAKSAGYTVQDWYEGYVPPENCIIEWPGHVAWLFSADSVGVNLRDGNIDMGSGYVAVHEQWWSWSNLKSRRGDPIGCIIFTEKAPQGCLDSSYSADGIINFSGWAFDADNTSAQPEIHVYIDGVYQGYGVANTYRSDVNAAYGVGDYHGFDFNISAGSYTGSHLVELYVLNVDKDGNYTGTNNTLFSSQTMVLDGDAEAPVISDAKVTSIDPYGYTVQCKVTDNVGVAKVQCPTWTDKDGQDDLASEWDKNPAVTATALGDDIYEFRVNISDHNNEYGIYNTHIYAFDAAGNSTLEKLNGIVVNEESGETDEDNSEKYDVVLDVEEKAASLIKVNGIKSGEYSGIVKFNVKSENPIIVFISRDNDTSFELPIGNQIDNNTIEFSLDVYGNVKIHCYLLGDLDFDGRVGSTDAKQLQRADAGIKELTLMQETVLDVNGDRDVNSTDSKQIQRYDAGFTKMGYDNSRRVSEFKEMGYRVIDLEKPEYKKSREKKQAYLKSEMQKALNNREEMVYVIGFHYVDGYEAELGFFDNTELGLRDGFFRLLPYSSFWLKDFAIAEYGNSNVNCLYEYELEYYDLTDDQIASMKKEIDLRTDYIVSAALAGGNMWDKLKIVHDELAKSITYTDGIDHVHDLYGALIENKCVCEGYALAFRYITEKLGIKCSVMKSYWNETMDPDSHAWNVVEDEYGNKTFIDVTWDDTDLYDAYGNEYLDYEHFGLSKKEMQKIDSHEMLYETGRAYTYNEDYNYHRHEGYYLYYYDVLLIDAIFGAQFSSGSNVLTVRFDNEDSYLSAKAGMYDSHDVLNTVLNDIGFDGYYRIYANGALKTIRVELYAV